MILVIILALVGAASSTEKLKYKYTNAYSRIWSDKGSGGDQDLSIWAAVNHDSQVCSLGDVAVIGYDKPRDYSILVHDSTGILSHPASFTKIWDDRGSGSDDDVTVYQMNPHYGYTCLGSVAVRDHNNPPDASKYCCVKYTYLVPALSGKLYTDKGTEADKDLSLWEVIRGQNTNAKVGGNFIAVGGYYRPSSTFLLDGSKTEKFFG